MKSKTPRSPVGKSIKHVEVAVPESESVKRPKIAKVSRGQRRKHLDERLRLLYQRVMLIERELHSLDENRFYRTCIFGSARIKPDTKEYQDVFTLARMLSWRGIDILTGGGPGLMEAANKGAKLGVDEKKSKSLSYGISIQLEFEPTPNQHLDVKRHHHKFSSRLDDFMRLSHSVVVTPGGIGTVLELFFTWQLIQVKHISPRPIVLMDKEFWEGVIHWMKEYPLKRGLVSAKDFDCVTIASGPEEAFNIVSKNHDEFLAKQGQKV
ncbi:MAG: LOG family protein [Bdellovibrionota bacterium]|nr:MAG: LOG family protein [Bdellovibrionota bacterium]